MTKPRNPTVTMTYNPTATVTVTGARQGVRRVIVGEHIFPVGEAVADVPADVCQQLEQREDLTVDVQTPTPQEETPA
jgi:anti-sigma factor RsiW